MEVIDIFTIATGVYDEYLYPFMNSLHFFMPGYFKRVHIISDHLEEHNGYSCEDYSTEIIHTMDMPFPMIITLKQHFIRNYMTDDMKYVFYFDPDAIFYEKDDDYWAEMKKNLEGGHLLLTENTAYAIQFDPSESFEKHIDSEAYIDKPKDKIYYTKGCFFAGNHDIMIKFCEKIMEMTKNDLRKSIIAQAIDESYITKILDNAIEGDNPFNIMIKRYVIMYSYVPDFDLDTEKDEPWCKDAFANVKWDNNIKKRKKGF